VCCSCVSVSLKGMCAAVEGHMRGMSAAVVFLCLALCCRAVPCGAVCFATSAGHLQRFVL